MALGLCCQWLVTRSHTKIDNILVSRALKKGRYEQGLYTDDAIRKVYTDNLRNLHDVLRDYVIPGGIRCMRMSSAAFPLFDLLPNTSYYDNEQTRSLMADIGRLVLDNGVRLTTHPGQFVVLSSKSANVRAKAVREMEFHGWVFDRMGLPRSPYYSINVHGGKKGETDQLVETINGLSDSARLRMTLENCEYAWSVSDLLAVSRRTGVPIVFDSHHFRFNNPDNLTGDYAMQLAGYTWPDGIRPLTHLSNTKEGFEAADKTKYLRQHSDFIYGVPDYQLAANNDGAIDIDIEAKRKNHAIYHAVATHGLALA